MPSLAFIVALTSIVLSMPRPFAASAFCHICYGIVERRSIAC